MIRLLSVFFLLLGMGPASAEDWPTWRGPRLDGSSRERNLPIKWSKTDNIAWQTLIPGWGTSTPAIWQDAVFVTTQVDDRQLREGDEALDAHSRRP